MRRLSYSKFFTLAFAKKYESSQKFKISNWNFSILLGWTRLKHFHVIAIRQKNWGDGYYFFQTQKILHFFFENFCPYFWLAQIEIWDAIVFTMESDSLSNFRSRFIIWNCEILSGNTVFRSLKIVKNTKNTVFLR